MSDSEQQCCGRQMTRIAVEHRAAGVELHSCPSCGRHAWQQDGRRVDRDQLLEALQTHRPPERASRRPRAGTTAGRTAEPAREDARRADLQRLLSTFIPHGSTS